MSRFSEECKKILEENGTNVYRLANNTGLERTTLQRMITGKRLPHIEFVKQFCKALRFCGEEEKHLMELYQMERIGESTYRNRQMIGSLLNHLEPSAHQSQQEIEEAKLMEQAAAIDEGGAAWTQIVRVLEEAFKEKEATSIHTNLPADRLEFFRALRLLRRKHPQTGARVFHVVCFQTNARETLSNLKSLYHMVPFALSENMEYASFYCYSRLSKSDVTQMMFPYYVVTSHQALIISGDLKSAILHTEPEKVQCYRDEAEKLLRQAKSLLHTAAKAEDSWEEYSGIVQESAVSCVFSPQPCFQYFLPETLFFENVKKCPKQIQAAAQKLMEWWEDTSKTRPVEYYTKEGLIDFMETGKFQAQAAAYLLPLSLTERVGALKRLLREKQEETGYLLKGGLRLSSNLTLEIHGRKHVLFIKTDSHGRFSFLDIVESSICEAFEDFAFSVMETEEVCTQKEQHEFVESLLQKYQNADLKPEHSR